MPRASAVAVENNWTKGLITEASGLNFPENAATETYDCVFELTGEVSRRNGFNVETGGQFNAVTADLSSVNEYVWNNVANRGDLTIIVQQVGSTVYFYQLNSGVISTGSVGTSVSLASKYIAGAPVPPAGGTICQFDTGNGRLYISHPYCNPFYVDYNPDANTITTTDIAIQIRDFTRISSDTNAIDTRPTTLSNAHKYNLYNQGWSVSALTADSSSEPVLDFYFRHSDDAFNGPQVYPSNVDIWWLFKNASFKVDKSLFASVNRGNTPAPNGHYITSAFNIDRSAASGISGLDTESSTFYRPSCLAFYAGRIFYGGTASGDYGDRIYFSQIIQNVNQIGKCYQQQDPTSEDDSDLLPSDGGVIVIPGMGVLKKLFALGPVMFAFASNGVWQISGTIGSGFAANNYTVSKISARPSTSPMSFVEAEETVFWWNIDGIYAILPNQTGNAYQVQSLTDSTIADFISAIPATNIPFVKGAYNSLDKNIQWVFRSTTADSIEEQFRYDRVLNFRIPNQSFYPWTISDTGTTKYVSGILATKGSGTSSGTETVTDNSGNPVTDASANLVTNTTVIFTSLSSSFFYTMTGF